MADPISLTVVAAAIPLALTSIESGRRLVIEGAPLIHDMQTERRLRRLNSLFHKARTPGSLTIKGMCGVYDGCYRP